MKFLVLSHVACPGINVALGLKQCEKAATPGLEESIRQKPWTISEIQTCVPANTRLDCVLPAAYKAPFFGGAGVGVGAGTGVGGKKMVGGPSVVNGAGTTQSLPRPVAMAASVTGSSPTRRSPVA